MKALNPGESRLKLIIMTTVAMSADALLRGQLAHLRERFDVHVITSPGPEVEKIREREGVPVHEVTMVRSPAPMRDLLALLRLMQLLRQLRPDIVHCYTSKAGVLGTVAARISRVPVRIRSVNGLPLMGSKGVRRRLLLFLERLSYRSATHVVANSRGLQKFVSRVVWDGDVGIIGNGSTNGVDLGHYRRTDRVAREANELRNRLGYSAGSFIVLFVGRIVRDKGIDELVDAIGALSVDDGRRVSLLLVGSREKRNSISARSSRMIAEMDQILEVGFVEDIRPYYALADVLVLPSYREGLPNVLLQGACFGLPLVATEIPGNTDIVEHGVTGLLIPAQDSNALANALRRLSSEPELGVHLGAAATDLVESRYDQEGHWSAIDGWYEMVVQ